MSINQKRLNERKVPEEAEYIRFFKNNSQIVHKRFYKYDGQGGILFYNPFTDTWDHSGFANCNILDFVEKPGVYKIPDVATLIMQAALVNGLDFISEADFK